MIFIMIMIIIIMIIIIIIIKIIVIIMMIMVLIIIMILLILILIIMIIIRRRMEIKIKIKSWRIINLILLYFCLFLLGFLPRDGYLIEKENIDRIRHIPTIIVQGRYDVVCPCVSAYDLKKVHRQFSCFIYLSICINDFFLSFLLLFCAFLLFWFFNFIFLSLFLIFKLFFYDFRLFQKLSCE